MEPISFALGALAALILAGLALAVAYGRAKRRQAARPPIRGYLDLIADLSPQQRARVEQIRQTFLPQVARIRTGLRQERAALAALLFAEPTDRPAIDAATDAILRHQAELEREVIEHIIEERDLLRPEQRRQFKAIITQQFADGGLGVHDARAPRQAGPK